MNKTIVFALFFLIAKGGLAQTSEQLEQQRLTLIKEIEQSQNTLSNLKSTKASNISKINALEEQIERQKKLIETIQKEIRLEPQDEKQSRKGENIDYNKLYEKLSSEALPNLNKNSSDQKMDSALIRTIYLKQLKAFSDTQKPQPKETIKSKSQILDEELVKLDKLYIEIDQLTDETMEKSQSQIVVEKQLDKQISQREQLNKKVRELLLNSQSSIMHNSSGVSSPIENQKGFLKYPLSSASIYLRYGEQKHPKNNKLVIVNSGLDLMSNSSSVQAIYDGQVVKIGQVSNNESTVIISHEGGFFSVYSNMTKVEVNKGETITKGKNLGACKKNSEGRYVLHFELWKERENLNPYHWLQNN